MKSLILVALSLFGIQSLAQTSGQPFQLAAGSYTSECWSATVSKNADGNVLRGQGYEKSHIDVVIKNNVHIEYSQYVSEGFLGNTITKTITTDLGKGQFKQTSEFTANDTYEGETKTTSNKFEVIVEVEDNRTISLKTKTDSEKEKPGVGEVLWNKMEDGRLIVQNFIRERKASTNSEGVYRETLVSNSFCIYTAEK